MKSLMTIEVSRRGVPCVIQSKECCEYLGYVPYVFTSNFDKKKVVKNTFLDDYVEPSIPVSIGDFIVKKIKRGIESDVTMYKVTAIDLNKCYIEMEEASNFSIRNDGYGLSLI